MLAAEDIAGRVINGEGHWQEGECAQGYCSTCARRIEGEHVWRWWLGLVAKLTVCCDCAESL